METINIFKEIAAEIERSNVKHGDNSNLPSLDQTLLKRIGGCTAKRMAEEYEMPTEERAKFKTDNKFSMGQVTHADIVIEELAESIACLNDEVKTRGELIQLACKAVGISFNPSNDSAVDRCKQMAANSIDQMHQLRSTTESQEVKRMASVAITEFQTAQMWAVKALTWKD